MDRLRPAGSRARCLATFKLLGATLFALVVPAEEAFGRVVSWQGTITLSDQYHHTYTVPAEG